MSFLSADKFAANFLKQPYPTMGLAPSANLAKNGNNQVVQENGNGTLLTGQTMWARIAAGIPFSFVVDGLAKATKTANVAGHAAVTKVGEGVQAVEGKVKSVVEPAKNLLTATVSYSKWIIVGLVAVAFIVFAAQVKTLVKS